VISNKPKALGIERAKALGLDTVVVDHKAYEGRQAFEEALHAQLTAMDAELVCCAGFMRILTPWFVSHWQGKLINIHPSLLPKYKGLCLKRLKIRFCIYSKNKRIVLFLSLFNLLIIFSTFKIY